MRVYPVLRRNRHAGVMYIVGTIRCPGFAPGCGGSVNMLALAYPVETRLGSRNVSASSTKYLCSYDVHGYIPKRPSTGAIPTMKYDPLIGRSDLSDNSFSRYEGRHTTTLDSGAWDAKVYGLSSSHRICRQKWRHKLGPAAGTRYHDARVSSGCFCFRFLFPDLFWISPTAIRC